MKRLVTLAVVILGSGPARADSNAEVYMTATWPDIQATIIGGPRLPLENIRLLDAHGASIAASSLREFKDGPDTVAIAFVIAGSEIMMGNSELVSSDDPSSYHGYLAELNRGLAALDLGHAMPPGSIGTVITYDSTARVRVAMGPVGDIGATSLGGQRDYYGKLGNELLVATTLAIDELHRARTSQKVLVVIGDGNDTNNEASAPQLALLKKVAAQDGIRTYGIIYKSPLSEEGNVLTKLIPRTSSVASTDGIKAVLNSVVGQIGDRYTITFPAKALRWDGIQQDLTVELARETTEPVAMVLGQRSESSSCAWWLQLAIGTGFIGLLALLLRLRARAAVA